MALDAAPSSPSDPAAPMGRGEDRALGWSGPITAAVLVLGAYALLYIGVYVVRARTAPGPMFGDFFAFWSFAKFAHAFPPGRIYEIAPLQAFQHHLPGGFDGFYPYPYPPIFLLLLWPLGWLGYVPAFLVWTGTSLTAYLAAMAGPAWRGPRFWLAVVAPTTLVSVVAGQNGLLTAALMIGGLRLLGRRPIWAGAVLGVLVFKPQLFVLVPIVLLAGRQWRALLGVTLSVLALCLASVVAFGPAMWLDWLHATPTFLKVAQDNRQHLLSLMPTVTAGLMDAGLPQRVAQAVQLVVAAGVTACLVWLFHRTRRSGPGELEAAALQVGAFLVTPYAFIYDMPMVTVGAVTVFQPRAGDRWRILTLGAPILAYMAPIFIMQGALRGTPAGALVLLALFAVIVRAAGAKKGPFGAALL